MSPLVVAYTLWLGFLVTWWLAAFWAGQPAVKAPAGQRLVYWAVFAISFGLLLTPPAGAFRAPIAFTAVTPLGWKTPLWRWSGPMAWALVPVELAGFAFSWWARLHLGRLWSGMMTLMEGHRVVDTGPYRLARHPIYTGFIVSAWATALIAAAPVALAGAAALTALLAFKAKDEERFLRRELGADAYDAYAARTPMLVPFLRL